MWWAHFVFTFSLVQMFQLFFYFHFLKHENQIFMLFTIFRTFYYFVTYGIEFQFFIIFWRTIPLFNSKYETKS